MKRLIPFFVNLCCALASAAPPAAHLVEVGDGIKVELLDWGGTGWPVILLAGFGNTAHVYEDFAPKLADACHVHVYGITRRGFGASSKPERGYSVPELAEDDWRVVQSLKIEKPVLAGHSVAGSELAFLGQKHSPQLAGLIFLDANDDPMDHPSSNPELLALTLKSMKGSPGPPPRTATDNASVEAYQAYQKRSGMAPFPAAEIRNMYEIKPDGSVGKNRTPPSVGQAMADGSIAKDYRGINIPVLALVAVLSQPAEQWKEQAPKDQQERLDSERLYELLMEFIHRWESNLKNADAKARIVELPGAHHYIFLSEEAQVLKETQTFLETLQN